MENKNNCVRVGFSTILWTVTAILLCAAPCGAEVLVSNGETLNVDYQINDWVTVQAGGTLNVWPVGIIDYGVYAQAQSKVNIYGGEFPYGSLTVQATDATVAIYGTGFTLTNASGAELDNTQNPQEIQITNPTQGGSGTLTWEYQSSQYTISFWSFADIKLAAPGGESITVNIEKAKVSWNHSEIHVHGKLYLPQGFWMDTLNPNGSVVTTLAGVEVANQDVEFELKGKKGDKWEYKDKENSVGNIKEFKIDWNRAKFDYEEGFVKFKVVGIFDPESFPDGSSTSSDKLEIEISLGQMISASDLIGAWTKKDDKHWDYKW